MNHEKKRTNEKLNLKDSLYLRSYKNTRLHEINWQVVLDRQTFSPKLNFFKWNFVIFTLGIIVSTLHIVAREDMLGYIQFIIRTGKKTVNN